MNNPKFIKYVMTTPGHAPRDTYINEDKITSDFDMTVALKLWMHIRRFIDDTRKNSPNAHLVVITILRNDQQPINVVFDMTTITPKANPMRFGKFAVMFIRYKLMPAVRQLKELSQ